MAHSRALAPDVPTSTAWQEGRRLYVRCGYKSQLNTALRDLGAHWDRDQGALWIGSTKRDAVLEAVRAGEGRKQAIQDVKDAGRWVHIPYGAHDVRARAKELDAVYGGGDRKGWWAMRTDEDQAEITGLIKAWHAAAEEARQEQAAADAEATRQTAQERRQQLLENSGRTPTGETVELRDVSTRRMNKHTAQGIARTPGDLVHLADGRRGVVLLDAEVWFVGEEWASSVCWHPQIHDEAHWDFKYTVAIVEPTDAEREQDAGEAAERKDAADIDDLIEHAAELTAPCTEGRSRIAEEDRVGQITVRRGSTRFASGTLILTRDGRVVWQHPGYYDEYRATEGTTTDPQVVDRVRRILAAGPRERSWNATGQQRAYFAITLGEHGA